jgi:hypothetical protein
MGWHLRRNTWREARFPSKVLCADSPARSTIILLSDPVPTTGRGRFLTQEISAVWSLDSATDGLKSREHQLQSPRLFYPRESPSVPFLKVSHDPSRAIIYPTHVWISQRRHRQRSKQQSPPWGICFRGSGVWISGVRVPLSRHLSPRIPSFDVFSRSSFRLVILFAELPGRGIIRPPPDEWGGGSPGVTCRFRGGGRRVPGPGRQHLLRLG